MTTDNVMCISNDKNVFRKLLEGSDFGSMSGGIRSSRWPRALSGWGTFNSCSRFWLSLRQSLAWVLKQKFGEAPEEEKGPGLPWIAANIQLLLALAPPGWLCLKTIWHCGMRWIQLHHIIVDPWLNMGMRRHPEHLPPDPTPKKPRKAVASCGFKHWHWVSTRFKKGAFFSWCVQPSERKTSLF